MGVRMELSDRIGRRLKLQDLHVLMAVVQAGSMSKAAVLLNTGQSAISRSIGELERALGVSLLERGPRGVEATQYGRVLLDGGTAVFDNLRQTVRSIEFLSDPAVGEVRVGCNLSVAASFVSAVVDLVSRRYPRIMFRLVTMEADALRDLHDRNLDFVIMRKSDAIADEQLGFEFLFDDSFVIAVGAQSPWARRRRIALPELVRESWVLPPPETPIGAAALEAFRASGVNFPRVTAVIGPALVRISLLATGRFVTMCSPSILRFPARRPEIKVLPIKLAIAPVPIGIVTLKNRALSPVAQMFIEHAREVAKPLATRK
jgi:DNA-binding transcriptional LysR family regulator